MSFRRITRYGEPDTHHPEGVIDITHHRQIKILLSPKDSATRFNSNIPEPFRSRPKLSRTPPNTTQHYQPTTSVPNTKKPHPENVRSTSFAITAPRDSAPASPPSDTDDELTNSAHFLNIDHELSDDQLLPISNTYGAQQLRETSDLVLKQKRDELRNQYKQYGKHKIFGACKVDADATAESSATQFKPERIRMAVYEYESHQARTIDLTLAAEQKCLHCNIL